MGLLLLGGQTDMVPTPGRYPAEDSETRAFTPARLRTTTAKTRPADSQRVGGARTNGQKKDPRDGPEENPTHTR
jgi:hypothetical protein